MTSHAEAFLAQTAQHSVNCSLEHDRERRQGAVEIHSQPGKSLGKTVMLSAKCDNTITGACNDKTAPAQSTT